MFSALAVDFHEPAIGEIIFLLLSKFKGKERKKKKKKDEKD